MAAHVNSFTFLANGLVRMQCALSRVLLNTECQRAIATMVAHLNCSFPVHDTCAKCTVTVECGVLIAHHRNLNWQVSSCGFWHNFTSLSLSLSLSTVFFGRGFMAPNLSSFVKLKGTNFLTTYNHRSESLAFWRRGISPSHGGLSWRNIFVTWHARSVGNLWI